MPMPRHTRSGCTRTCSCNVEPDPTTRKRHVKIHYDSRQPLQAGPRSERELSTHLEDGHLSCVTSIALRRHKQRVIDTANDCQTAEFAGNVHTVATETYISSPLLCCCFHFTFQFPVSSFGYLPFFTHLKPVDCWLTGPASSNQRAAPRSCASRSLNPVLSGRIRFQLCVIFRLLSSLLFVEKLGTKLMHPLWRVRLPVL